MNHLDLCSGIGGFALAARWMGWQTVGFAEIDPFASRVLAKHWPGVPNYGDLRDLEVDDDGNIFSITSTGEIMGRPRQEKYDCSVSLYESGFSIGDCADYFGITRQAMHKILKRRGVVFREQLKYGDDNHFFRGGSRSSDRAHNLTEQAILKGILIRQPCEVCGETGNFVDGRSRVQAHHDDYTKPLEVRWLCQQHHHEWHKLNSAKGESGEPATGREATILTCGFP